MHCKRSGCILSCALVVAIGACAKQTSIPDSSAAALPPSALESTASSGHAGVPHACDLLTAQDAERVLGPGAYLIRGEVACDVAPGKNRPTAIGLISAKIEPARDEWATSKQTLMQLDKSSKSVSGLGDDAYWVMGSLFIKKGAAQISVIGSKCSDEKSREEAVRSIGQEIAARM
jgi:hypothetical protein